MARDFSAAALAHFAGTDIREVHFAYFDLVGGALRITTAPFDITWGGNTWEGSASQGTIIGSVSAIQEASDIGARSVTFRVSGFDSSLLSQALDRTDYKGRTVQLYVGALDTSDQLLADPDLYFAGTMDVARLASDEGVGLIELDCESEMVRLLRPNISRHSDEDHQQRHAGDKFYEHAAQMAQKDVTWGGQRMPLGAGGGLHDRAGPGRLRIPF